MAVDESGTPCRCSLTRRCHPHSPFAYRSDVSDLLIVECYKDSFLFNLFNSKPKFYHYSHFLQWNESPLFTSIVNALLMGFFVVESTRMGTIPCVVNCVGVMVELTTKLEVVVLESLGNKNLPESLVNFVDSVTGAAVVTIS